MAFDRNYDALITLATELGQYEGYLDNEDKKAFGEARGAYAAERNRTAYEILSEKPDIDLVYERIRGDLASIAEESPDYAGICEFVAEDLIEKLQEESQKSSVWRMTKRYAGAGILAVLAIIYMGLFVYNDLTVDQPLETKEGLIQHAAAYDKLRTYNDMMDTRSRRGGFFKGLLFWPFEPDEQELEAASNFVGLSLDALQALTEDGVTCDTQYLLNAGEFLDDGQIAFIDDISAYVQAEATVWEEPAIMTPIPMIAERYGCPVQLDSNG